MTSHVACILTVPDPRGYGRAEAEPKPKSLAERRLQVSVFGRKVRTEKEPQRKKGENNTAIRRHLPTAQLYIRTYVSTLFTGILFWLANPLVLLGGD